MKDERQTIEAVLSGNAAAFEAIIHEYKAHVFRIAANMVAAQDVEEVAHEAFIRAFRDLRTYRFKAPFQHWLSRVTVRTCYDYWRRERRRKVQPMSDDDLRALESEVSRLQRNEEAAVQRAKEILQWALGELAPEDRLAFTLLYLEDLSLKEVAETMGWSLAKIKTRSFRARRALRRLLNTKLARKGA